MSCEVDKFLQYLCDKYFIFDPIAELDESNTIDDIDIIKKGVKEIKKVTDDTMIVLCGNILDKFKCYNISSNIKERISIDSASEIYLHYKRYKCSSNTRTRETEVSLRLDNSLNTNGTYYITSLKNVTTDMLRNTFGDYIRSGGKQDKFRYEYRFRFAKDGKVYIFSVYDYQDDNGEFYQDEDIFWHVASNTDSKDVSSSFITMLSDMTMVTDCC